MDQLALTSLVLALCALVIATCALAWSRQALVEARAAHLLAGAATRPVQAPAAPPAPEAPKPAPEPVDDAVVDEAMTGEEQTRQRLYRQDVARLERRRATTSGNERLAAALELLSHRIENEPAGELTLTADELHHMHPGWELHLANVALRGRQLGRDLEQSDDVLTRDVKLRWRTRGQ